MALAATIELGHPSPDEALLQRLVRRDGEALAELHDRYGRVVFAMLHRMLPTPEAAEEVCQDAFHHLWRRADSYRGERGSVRTWLLAIARNAAIDWRRTRGRRIELEVALEDAWHLPAQSSLEDQVGERLRGQAMWTLIGALPAEQRQCLQLAYWGGLSQSEIATRTGVPLGTVKSRIRLAMEKLRGTIPLGHLDI